VRSKTLATVKRTKKQDQDDSPEAVLARLSALSERLDGVQSGDTTQETPEISIVQTHPLLSEMLFVKGVPLPGLWIPNYVALAKRRGISNIGCTYPETGRSSPCGDWSCTQIQDISSCAGGYSHVAVMDTDWEEAMGDPDSDMVLEWWEIEPDRNGSWRIAFYPDPSTEWITRIAVQDFTPWYRDEYSDGKACGAPGPNGWVCTLHRGHEKYSHVAGDASKILAVW